MRKIRNIFIEVVCACQILQKVLFLELECFLAQQEVGGGGEGTYAKTIASGSGPGCLLVFTCSFFTKTALIVHLDILFLT